jgi:hypothetical protein
VRRRRERGCDVWRCVVFIIIIYTITTTHTADFGIHHTYVRTFIPRDRSGE